MFTEDPKVRTAPRVSATASMATDLSWLLCGAAKQSMRDRYPQLAAIFSEYVEWREKHPSDYLMTELMTVEFTDETGTKRRLTRDELLWRAGDVLKWIEEGKLKLRIERTYPLAEAAAAHKDLEGRHTAGKLLLIPQ